MSERQIVMDTETTGIDPKQGHRIVEIGCVELIDRKLTGNNYHVYLNPDRQMDQEVINVHGITNEFVRDKPRYAEIADEFLSYIKGAELVIHNAPFDVGFMNHEFDRLRKRHGHVEDHCTILDTLAMARNKHPGQKNNLDALCKRYFIDNSSRTFHGALLDSEILAEVYLAMTGGQTALSLSAHGSAEEGGEGGEVIRRLSPERPLLHVIQPTEEEEIHHKRKLEEISGKAGHCLWSDA